MIINHFKMRSNIVSYNLAGMGCSAGVIAINLAKELLQVCPRAFAAYTAAPFVGVSDLPGVNHADCLDG